MAVFDSLREMRSSSLKPRKSDLSPNLPWLVEIPPHLSETGKRKRKFFKTEKEAKAECEALKARKDNFGISLSTMSAARIAEAAEAYKLLDPFNVSLLDAVRAHVAGVKARSASITFGEAFNRFAEIKKGKSPKYNQEIKHTKATFEPLLDRMVCDITPADLEPILDRLPAASRNAKMRRLRSVFNLAAKRKWMGGNSSPITAMDFSDNRRGEVEVFPVETVRALLDHALEHDLEFLPYRVFSFFCGIRPQGELERLEWSDVKITEKTVVLRAEITKTHRKRFVDLSDNAIAWLTEYQARGGKMTALVAPWTPQIRRTKHRTSYKAVGIKKWIQQGARHSYCSYWLAKYKDANKLVLQSGHTDANTMWTRYHQGVTEAQAEKFWSIVPPNADAKIIAFASA
jgi:integrase